MKIRFRIYLLGMFCIYFVCFQYVYILVVYVYDICGSAVYVLGGKPDAVCMFGSRPVYFPFCIRGKNETAVCSNRF